MQGFALWVHEPGDKGATLLKQTRMGGASGFDEAWLQERIFENPALIPIGKIEPGSSALVPLCRELPLGDIGPKVFLDLLMVSSTGRLTLVECKLWRNRESRRAVLGQVFEYASLVQAGGYAELIKAVSKRLGGGGERAVFERAQQDFPDLDESLFIDGLTHSVEAGEFNLLIVGDGIRSGLHGVRQFLDNRAFSASQLALVEMQIWRGPTGETLVVPHVPLQTEVIKQRVLVDGAGRTVPVEEEGSDAAEIPAELDEDAAARRATNRAFWDRLIKSLKLSDVDQPPPRHGGNNWIKLVLPDPASHMTAYRTADNRVGVFFRMQGDDGRQLFEAFVAEKKEIEQALGSSVAFKGKGENDRIVAVSSTVPGDEAQAEYLRNAINAMVDTFRPRLR